jgi:hypothetical protein
MGFIHSVQGTARAQKKNALNDLPMGAAISIPLRAKTHRFALLQVSLTLPATMSLAAHRFHPKLCFHAALHVDARNLEKPLRPFLGWSLNHQPT